MYFKTCTQSLFENLIANNIWYNVVNAVSITILKLVHTYLNYR